MPGDIPKVPQSISEDWDNVSESLMRDEIRHDKKLFSCLIATIIPEQ